MSATNEPLPEDAIRLMAGDEVIIVADALGGIEWSDARIPKLCDTGDPRVVVQRMARELLALRAREVEYRLSAYGRDGS